MSPCGMLLCALEGGRKRAREGGREGGREDVLSRCAATNWDSCDTLANLQFSNRPLSTLELEVGRYEWLH